MQRWLKMSKYFKQNNIDLPFYTPEDPEYPAMDESGRDEVPEDLTVIKHPIMEPHGSYKRLVGKKRNEKVYSAFIGENKSWKHRFAIIHLVRRR